MAIKPQRGRYLTLEDVRVSYKHKDDTIHLTSQDPEIPNGEFFITLNRNTSTEAALRELLTEHDLIRQENVPVEEEKPYFRSGINPIPEHLMNAKLYNHKNNSSNYALIGSPGSGKSVVAMDVVARAHAMNIPTTVVGLASDYAQSLWSSGVQDITFYNFGVTERSPSFTTPLPRGHFNPFQMSLSDEQRATVLKKILVSAYKNTKGPDLYYLAAAQSFIDQAATEGQEAFLLQEAEPTLLKFFAFIAANNTHRIVDQIGFISWLISEEMTILLTNPALSWNPDIATIPAKTRTVWYDIGEFDNRSESSGRNIFVSNMFGELIYAKQEHHYLTRPPQSGVELFVLDNVFHFQGMHKSYLHLMRLTRSTNVVFVTTHHQLDDFCNSYKDDAGLAEFLLFRGAFGDKKTVALGKITDDMLKRLPSGEFWCSDQAINRGVVHVSPHISFNISFNTNPNSEKNKPVFEEMVANAIRQDSSSIIVGEVRDIDAADGLK
jgi:hypothetical protein